MERTKILSYCKICVNRINNLKKGTICGLTNELGAFEKNCSSYTSDKTEIENKKRQIRSIIETDLGHFKEFDAVNRNSSQSKHEIYESKAHYYLGIGLSFIVLSSIIYNLFLHKKSLNDILIPSIFGLITFSFSLYSLLRISRKPIMEINNSFVKYRDKKVYLNDILILGIASEINNSDNMFLIFGTVTKKVIKIRLEELKIERIRLINIINSMRNNVA